MNGPTVSTFHFNTAGGSAQDATDAVAGFLNDIHAEISSSLTWATEPEVDTLNTATGVLEDVTSVTTYTDNGELGDSVLPLTTQGLVRWTTGIITSGRALKGHMFVPGMTEVANAGGNPTSTVQTAIQADVDEFLAGATGFFSIWSRTHGVLASVTAGSMAPTWAYLSSRRD